MALIDIMPMIFPLILATMPIRRDT